MSTVNLSLPSEQINFIDTLVARHSFGSRSELVRSLIRLITRRPELIDRAVTFPFVAPKERSVKTVLADFQRTKKYSKAFFNDLKEGLKNSDYFKP